jgi:serine/threonine protein phosphatase PrpC
MLSVRAAMRSCVGGRAHNEDSVAFESSASDWCCVLSDGAGGHSGGAVASAIAVARILAGFKARPTRDPDDLRELILDAHDAVVAAQRGQQNGGPQMQATIVVLVIDASIGRAMWGHVGDSRLYLLRRGKIAAMTRDDSVVQWMVDAGHLKAEEARTHPNKNRLFAALGMEDEISPKLSAPASEIQDGDALLLCSDGWWEYLEDADIEASFARAGSLDDWLGAMEHLVSQRGKPGQDNYSALAVCVGDALERTLMTGLQPGMEPDRA